VTAVALLLRAAYWGGPGSLPPLLAWGWIALNSATAAMGGYVLVDLLRANAGEQSRVFITAILKLAGCADAEQSAQKAKRAALWHMFLGQALYAPMIILIATACVLVPPRTSFMNYVLLAAAPLYLGYVWPLMKQRSEMFIQVLMLMKLSPEALAAWKKVHDYTAILGRAIDGLFTDGTIPTEERFITWRREQSSLPPWSEGDPMPVLALNVSGEGISAQYFGFSSAGDLEIFRERKAAFLATALGEWMVPGNFPELGTYLLWRNRYGDVEIGASAAEGAIEGEAPLMATFRRIGWEAAVSPFWEMRKLRIEMAWAAWIKKVNELLASGELTRESQYRQLEDVESAEGRLPVSDDSQFVELKASGTLDRIGSYKRSKISYVAAALRTLTGSQRILTESAFRLWQSQRYQDSPLDPAEPDFDWELEAFFESLSDLIAPVVADAIHQGAVTDAQYSALRRRDDRSVSEAQLKWEIRMFRVLLRQDLFKALDATPATDGIRELLEKRIRQAQQIWSEEERQGMLFWVLEWLASRNGGRAVPMFMLQGGPKESA